MLTLKIALASVISADNQAYSTRY